MTTLRKTFELGKIAYYGSRRENAVDVTVELREKEHGELEFSATGNIWNRIHTDILSGGQNLDEIAKFKGNNPIFKEIYKFWKLYHLNTMHPECKHQAALGWREIAAKRVEVEEYGRKTTKLLGWLYPNEHPEGILTKECPVCGYKYGTKWNYFEIPENDLNRIKELLTEEK